MSHKNDDIIWAAMGCGFGGWLFYKGFKDLRLERAIANTPTSKTRSMAMGPVELMGTAEVFAPLTDPIYGEPCTFYQIDVEEERGSGKNSHWVSIYHADSFAQPFLLADDTGTVPILPDGAELYCNKAINTTSSWLSNMFSNVEEPVANFLNGLPGRTTNTLRITAYILRQGNPVSVLGYAEIADPPLACSGAVGKTDLSPSALARRLKADPEKMKALGVNPDGEIDVQKWDRALEKFKEELEEQREQAPAAPSFPVFVRKNPNGFFILSDKSERDLVSSLKQEAGADILLGPLLSVGCAAYLAWRLKLLSF